MFFVEVCKKEGFTLLYSINFTPLSSLSNVETEKEILFSSSFQIYTRVSFSVMYFIAQTQRLYLHLHYLLSETTRRMASLGRKTIRLESNSVSAVVAFIAIFLMYSCLLLQFVGGF